MVSPRRSGFTLVEVLVALVIMSTVAVMAWRGIDGIARTRAASEERLDRALRLNTVLAQWERDIASVVDTQVLPSALAFDGATVRLTRRAEGGVQFVAWSLKPTLAPNGAPGQGDWLRWASPVVRTAPELQEFWFRSQQFNGTEPGQLKVLGGLAGWQVYFYQGNAWSNAQSTGNMASTAATSVGQGASAPAAARQALPGGVRVVLSFGEGSAMNGTLTRDVALGPQP